MRRRLHNNETEEDFDKQSNSKRKRSNEEIEVKQENSEETAIKNEPLVDEEENEESTIINYNSMPYVLEPGEILPVTKEEDILDDDQPKTSDTDDQGEVFALTESTNNQHQSSSKGSPHHLEKIASPTVKLSQNSNPELVKRISRNNKALLEKQNSVPTPSTSMRVSGMWVKRLQKKNEALSEMPDPVPSPSEKAMLVENIKAFKIKVKSVSALNTSPESEKKEKEVPSTDMSIAPELSPNTNPVSMKRICYTDKNLIKKLVPVAPPSNTNSNVKLFKIRDIQRPPNKIIIMKKSEEKQDQETNNRKKVLVRKYIGKRVTYENPKKLLLAPESEMLSSSEEETPVPVPSTTPKAVPVNVNKKLSVLQLPNEKKMYIIRNKEPSIDQESKVNREVWPKLLSFPCPICGEAVGTKLNLLKHLNEAHVQISSDDQLRWTMCQLCLEQTPIKDIFWHTISQSCRSKWLGSCKCVLTFANFEELQYHIAEEHPKSIPPKLSQKLWPRLLSMPCFACFRVCKREILSNHLRGFHWRKGPSLCLFCKEIVEYKDLVAHSLLTSCRAEWTKGCQCVIKFADWKEFQTHLRLKHPQNEKKEEDLNPDQEKTEEKKEEIPKTAILGPRKTPFISCDWCSKKIPINDYVAHYREFHVAGDFSNKKKAEDPKPGHVKKLVKKKNEEKPGTAILGPRKTPFMSCDWCSEKIPINNYVAHCRKFHESGDLSFHHIAEDPKPGPVKKLVKKKNEEKPGTAKPGPLKKFVTQPNNPFMTCPLCDETIKTIDCLSHIQEFHKSETSHPTNMHTCKQCNKDVSLRNITTHILNMCASAHRYCFYCQEKQTNWMFLINHLDKYHKTYCCNACNVVCGEHMDYQKHAKSRFHKFNSNPDAKEKCIKKRPKNFCPLCPIGAVVQNLQLHLRIIHSDVMIQPDNLNTCQVCKQEIKTTDLVEHTKVCLDEQMPFCDICQISFMHKDIFEQHLSIHAPPGAIPLKDNGPCPLCLEKDPQGSLILHLKVKHSNFREIKVFRCVFCDLLIKGSFLLNHANSRECREKRICSVCSAVFKDWNALGAHKCEKLVENQNS